MSCSAILKPSLSNKSESEQMLLDLDVTNISIRLVSEEKGYAWTVEWGGACRMAKERID